MPKTKSDDESFSGAPSSRYSRITQHTKDKLCYIVITTSLKVKSAAKILKINSSTAKMILKKFYQMSLSEQSQVLQRGAKSKKEKCQKLTKQNSTSGAQNFKKQMQEREDEHKSMPQLEVIVKSQIEAEEGIVMAKQESKKEQQFSPSQCVYFYCPLYNFCTF